MEARAALSLSSSKRRFIHPTQADGSAVSNSVSLTWTPASIDCRLPLHCVCVCVCVCV